MSHGRFVKMLQSQGFEPYKHKNSAKLCFYIFKNLSRNELSQVAVTSLAALLHVLWSGLVGQSAKWNARVFERKLCRGGLERNNFCIIIRGRQADSSEEDDDDANDQGRDPLGDEEHTAKHHKYKTGQKRGHKRTLNTRTNERKPAYSGCVQITSKK